ncbi:Fc.00g063410.m01.CDS01 [Cosmosporella sp. VM-42]
MAKRAKGLAASAKAVDPTLDALFSSTNSLQAGPVKAPPKSRYSELLEQKPRSVPKESSTEEDGQEEGDDEVLSEISEELHYEDDDDEEDEDDGDNASETSDQEEEDQEDGEDSNAASADAETTDEAMEDVPVELDTIIQAAEGDKQKRERKRKRKEANEDLEDKYLSKLVTEDEVEPVGKRQKSEKSEDGEKKEEDEESDIPVHETLAKEADTSDIEKASRTVFLANVSTEAISRKSAKKTLMAHLSSVLDADASPVQKIESIRFRSVAFAGGALPKRAAYITKTLMEATTKSANAYVVYSTTAAARTAATKLNGTEVLGRHIRVDSVAHPSPTDHRRCVFVGNLGFVDDETVLNTNADGETKEKKKNKVPSDIEEGLWRTFGKVGRVENVRVVRDPKTRVGKGFAYVQFYDGNHVESAVHLDGKKFPPMLPRLLRVTRAKDPRKTALAQERAKSRGGAPNGDRKSMKHRPKATPEQQSMAGRAAKLLGRGGAAQQRHGKKQFKSGSQEESASTIRPPEQFVFEGRRATTRDALPKDLKGKKSKGKKAGKPQNRGTRRAAEWKKKSG